MKHGILYNVGVGPGDPELVTRKAVRLLTQADVIAVPDKGTGAHTALGIVADLAQEKPLLMCPAPMTRDEAVLEQCQTRIGGQICELLEAGKTVCFITLGDPSIYSTYIYIHKKVAAAGYEAELVPGVPSFCAAAARLGISLCERDQRLMIVPAGSEAEDVMQISANKVFMEAGGEILRLQQSLRRCGMLEQASAVENCGMDDEHIWERFSDMQTPSGYFSLGVVKESE